MWPTPHNNCSGSCLTCCNPISILKWVGETYIVERPPLFLLKLTGLWKEARGITLRQGNVGDGGGRPGNISLNHPLVKYLFIKQGPLGPTASWSKGKLWRKGQRWKVLRRKGPENSAHRQILMDTPSGDRLADSCLWNKAILRFSSNSLKDGEMQFGAWTQLVSNWY